MKTIYLDSDFRCHLTDDGTRQVVETDAFDGKCDTYIEGYRYIPAGQTWSRSDGVEFSGEMISPWRPWQKLDNAQRTWEREQYQTLATENAALTEENATLAVALDELDAEYRKGVDSL